MLHRIARASTLLRLALVPLALGACALPSVHIQPRYAALEISGTAGMSSGGVGGAADMEQAGLDDDETLAGRVDLDLGSPHFVFLGQAPRFEGSGTLDVTVGDGTNTIVAGASVASQVDIGLYDAALVFDLLPTDLVELGIGIGAAYLDLDLEFEEDLTGTTVTSAEAFPVPILAAVGGVWLGPVEVSAFVGGIDIEYDDDSLTYLDADVFARLKLLGGSDRLRASLVVGYRYTDVELDYDDDDAEVRTDLTIDGPYLGLEVAL